MNNKSSDWACHVSIYAGYKAGYHWVYHVGNDNGPEFCAMERFCYGPDPVWPLAVISTPTNIRFSAGVEVTVKDNDGKAVAGSEIILKNHETGVEKSIGVTNEQGVVTGEGFEYSEYTVIQKVPTGYTCDSPEQTISFTPANNSLSKITFTNSK